MRGYGPHKQPPGTWSDNSALTFCLLESLSSGDKLRAIGDHFVQWLYCNRWTAHGRVFDAGNTTYCVEMPPGQRFTIVQKFHPLPTHISAPFWPGFSTLNRRST
ncbi:MAG: ADP-ribosylglycohydrolase family protein [Bacteroidia bacterium]|nr:ADP-ribosylglycohydrolase family protein [Bacteroidia bacterium]